MTRIDNKGTLGERIADKRKELGLTEQELADALHINRTMISRIEHGKSSISIEHVIPLCRKLQITPNVLFNWIARTTEDICRECSVSEKRALDRVVEEIYAEFIRKDEKK